MASSSKGRSSLRKKSGAGKARVISTKRKDALPRTGGVSEGRRKPVVLPPIDAPTEPPATVVAAPRKKAHSLHKKPNAGRKKATRAADAASTKLDEPAAKDVTQAAAATPSEIVEVAAPAPDVAEVRAAVVEVLAEIAAALEPTIVTAPEPVAETVVAVEPPATIVTAPEPIAATVVAVEPPPTEYEEFAMTALEAPRGEAPAVVETELEVEASAIIVEELSLEELTAPSIAIGPPPIPEETRVPAPVRTIAAAPVAAPPGAHYHRRSRMPVISRLLSTLGRWTGVSGTK